MGILDDAIREHLDLKRKHGVAEDELQRQEEEALGPARRDVAQQPEDTGSVAEPASLEAEADEPGPFDGDAPTVVAGPPATTPPASEPLPSEPPADKAPVTDPPMPEPPVTDPSIGEPAATDTPAAEAPGADPGLTDPPAAEAPGADPGLTDPPAAEAPVIDPPDTEPPVIDPPIEEPPVEEPPIETPVEEPPLEEPPGPPEGSPAGGKLHDDDPAVAPSGLEETTHPDEASPIDKAATHEDHLDDEDLDVLEDTPDFLQETPEHDRLWFEQKPPRDFDFD